MSALDQQHGGDHYKNRKMQPVELWAALNLNGFQATIVKYLTRHKEKNGAQDIDKAEHVFELAIELGTHALSYSADPVHEYATSNGLGLAGYIAILSALELDGRSFREALDDIRRENGYPVPERG